MKRTLTIVGAGRVGRELGRRLAELGWQVGAVVTRSQASARAAVRAIGAGTPCAMLDSAAIDASLILITTPDDAIAPVARRLAKLAKKPLAGRTVLHASGALASDVLEPLKRRGAAIGSMHPMQTFTSGRKTRLDGVCFAVEGDPRARRLATRLARQLGGAPVTIESRAKAAYHAAGAFASPQLLAVMETGVRMLEGIGFRRAQAFAALMPMARQTLENLERLGPRGAWTGPVSRGDVATVRRHEKELQNWPAEYGEAYRALVKLQRRVLSGKK